MTAEEFWNSSLSDVILYQWAYEDRIKLSQRQGRAIAWHTAALTKSKKLPDPEKFINGSKPVSKDEVAEDREHLKKLAEKSGRSIRQSR